MYQQTGNLSGNHGMSELNLSSNARHEASFMWPGFFSHRVVRATSQL